MRPDHRLSHGLPGLLVLLCGLRIGAADAAVHEVAPGGDTLSQVLAHSQPGDVVRLLPGVHRGGVVIDRSITLEGSPGATLDGSGHGSVLKVAAPDVIVRGLLLRRSGDSAGDLDSGIHLTTEATAALIEGNQLEENLFGIAVQGAKRVTVRHNRIANRNEAWLNDRGNGINIWNTTGSVIEANEVQGGRDGLFITTAHGNIIRNNRFRDLRFAVHYMYANNNEIRGNHSTGNAVGYALMYSNDLKVFDNVSIGDRDHGLMFHTSHRSEVARNVVQRTQDKCAFVYTSAGNAIHDNWFEGCAIGLHFSGGSEKNHMYGNTFMNNQTQVKYAGMVHYEWSRNQRGNYWSDNPAFDLNGDGIADLAYRPNDLVDRVIWSYPLAKLLLSSPVLETLRFAQRQFPALSPGGVVDSWPLMTPPTRPTQTMAGVR